VVWIYSVALTAGASGWGLVAAVFPALLAVFSFLPDNGRRRRFAAALALSAACYVCGALSYARFEHGYHRVRSRAIEGGARPVALAGSVAGFPTHRPGSVRFRFDTSLNGQPLTVLASTTAFGLGFGDSLVLTGKLSSGRYDRRGYLQSQGASGYLRVPTGNVTELPDGQTTAWAAGRIAWRAHDSVRRRLARNLGARAGLPTALSIGERGRVPRRVNTAFARLGTSHLLALSGMHLGMIAAAALGLLRLAGRRNKWVLLPLLAAYVFVVGRVVSLYRAYALAAVMIVSSRTERPIDAVHGLGVALFVLLAAQPGLVHSVAFQLSFTATLGVLIGATRMRRRAGGTRLRRVATTALSALAVGICAQIFLLPLQLRYFGGVTPITPAATLVLVPPVAAVMLLTGIALAADLLLPPLSGVAFAALGGFVGVFERTVVAVSMWMPAPIDLPAPNTILYYSALGVCLKIFDAVFRRPVL
jgi:ComEC/Rec2-related protein